MKILITNDDGIASPILPHLIRWAKKHGEVTTVAPKVEQSGMSQAIDFYREVEIKQVSLAPDSKAWAMNSTPADCVRFGVLGLGKRYDLILSGINRGYNLGDDIVYSGTVGAIFEGARLGIPGIALSTDPDSLFAALDQLDTLAAFINRHGLMAQNSLYNVNFPAEAQGIRMTKQGGMFYTDAFEHRGGDMYIQVGEPVKDSGTDLASDINAIRNGYISVTPLIATRTDLAAFERLKALSQKL